MELLRPSASLHAALSLLTPCEPFSLDQLDRTVRLLADTRDDLAVVGAWVVGPDRLAIVTMHERIGPVGYVSDPLDGHHADFTHHASRIVSITDDEVTQWARRGWQRHGAIWNSEPHQLTTPWDDRTDLSDLPRIFPGRDLSTWISPDLVLKFYVTGLGDRPMIPATRLLAAWVAGSDAVVTIHAHANPRWLFSSAEAREENFQLLDNALAPHQRYLWLGRFFTPPAHESADDATPFLYGPATLDRLYSSVSDYETAFYPGSLLARTQEAWGIRWFAPMPEKLNNAIARMAENLRSVDAVT